ncbi:hypothetical protein [Formosa algae]|uniref:DUF748 domain-containing protein n=1 Tax=Formosa algae TaxID=225843 RepID=A0A9X0YM89_9FLAO|nr:hypothetical protein [Formosa algae]MBP1839817.1 hypothetical protein [Formosa algae]MDQ0335416.1 hypothetical protein [Formosa algae]OEI79194.1 hypothetical protein AST99_15325 [Formosa algae]
MPKLLKKSITILLVIVCVLGLIVVFFANTFVEQKLKTALKDLPETVQFTYSGLAVNVFQGELFVENPELEVSELDNTEMNLKISLNKFKLEEVSYWRYIFYGAIHLDRVLFQDADIFYVKSNSTKESDSTNMDSSSKSKNKSIQLFNKTIKIDQVEFNHAKFTMYKAASDSVFLKSENLNIMFQDILVDEASSKKNIPFEYSNYHISSDSLKFNVGVYETLSLQTLEFTKSHWVVRDFALKTKYSKQELTRRLKKERDHFNIEMDSIYIENPRFGFLDKRFYFKSDTITIQKPDAIIYRNKLVADDYTIKPMYSKMLRDLNFDLTIPVLQLNSGSIVYEEKVKANVQAGSIAFKDFNATIKHVSNTYTSPTKTELDITTRFFGQAPLHANWAFDVNNNNDDFTFKTQIGVLPASRLNRFTEHNLNIKLEGQFDKIYARIDGNVDRSTVNFNVKYEDMKVNILNKKKKRNRFLSSIANLFIRNDSDKNKDGFIEKKGAVTRDKTKSVFNFFWLNIKEGLKLVFIGDGII